MKHIGAYEISKFFLGIVFELLAEIDVTFTRVSYKRCYIDEFKPRYIYVTIYFCAVVLYIVSQYNYIDATYIYYHY